MIVQLIELKTGTKRYMLVMDNGKRFKFGFRGGSTFLDHGDEAKRINYLKRHLANPTENYLINNLIPSASLFSAYLLWGPYTNIEQNAEYLNSLFKSKYHPDSA